MKESHRSSDVIEKQFIHAILSGEYAAGSILPSERDLAVQYGVGRPTIREVLQRLERDGWVTCRKGQPAIVNDYWQSGNLSTIVNIVNNQAAVTDEFIIYLLELRCALAPAYVRDAIVSNQAKVVALLANLEILKDDAEQYALFDWELQRKLANLSHNPIYLLVLNSFNSIYTQLATRYFSIPEHRSLVLEYYCALLAAALKGQPAEAESIVKDAMHKSIVLWTRRQES